MDCLVLSLNADVVPFDAKDEYPCWLSKFKWATVCVKVHLSQTCHGQFRRSSFYKSLPVERWLGFKVYFIFTFDSVYSRTHLISWSQSSVSQRHPAKGSSHTTLDKRRLQTGAYCQQNRLFAMNRLFLGRCSNPPIRDKQLFTFGAWGARSVLSADA